MQRALHFQATDIVASRQIWHYVKPILPYMVFSILVAVGSCILYFCERNAPKLMDQKANHIDICVGSYDYWAALFYTFSVCSTIGFGILYPCTIPSKIITILLALVGIPTMFLILADLGKRMCNAMIHIYTYSVNAWQKFKRRKFSFRKKFRRLFRKRRKSILLMETWSVSEGSTVESLDEKSVKSLLVDQRGSISYADRRSHCSDNPALDAAEMGNGQLSNRDENMELNRRIVRFSDMGVEEDLDDEEISSTESEFVEYLAEDADLPIGFGVALIGFCIMSSSCYFHFTGTEVYFHLSVYYSILFLLFGSYDTKRFDLAIPTYIFLFVCFAAISTTISIILHNIEALLRRMKKRIPLEIQARLAAQERGEVEEGDIKTAEEIVAEIMGKEAPAWMRGLVNETQLDNLVDFYEEKETATPVNKNIQTVSEGANPILEKFDECLQWPPVPEDVGCGTPIEWDARSIQAVPPTVNKKLQVSPKTKELEIQTQPETANACVGEPLIQKIAEIQAVLSHVDREVDAPNLNPTDVAVQHAPFTRDQSFMYIYTPPTAVASVSAATESAEVGIQNARQMAVKTVQAELRKPGRDVAIDFAPRQTEMGANTDPKEVTDQFVEAHPDVRTVKCQSPKYE